MSKEIVNSYSLRQQKKVDNRFNTWLQEKIVEQNKNSLLSSQERLKKKDKTLFSLFHKKEITSLKKTILATQEKQKHLSSREFKAELSHWQPWKLDETSVRNGTNLYVNLAKEYAGEDFIKWVKECSEKCGVAPDQFVVKIIESVRKAQWETIKIMAKEGKARTYVLPHTLIGANPPTDITIFLDGIEKARKDKTKDSFLNLKKMIDSLHPSIRIPYAMLSLNHNLAFIIVGKVMLGGYRKNTTSIDWRNFKLSPDQIIDTVVEEEIHHQGYKRDEIKRRKAQWKDADILDQNYFEKGEQIEIESGFKDYKKEVLKKFPPPNIFFGFLLE